MIDRDAIEAIIAQYTKHGWILRRVSLSAGALDQTSDAAAIFGEVEISGAEIDGLWFSRSSRPGLTAWELRHLSATPYALVENLRDDAPEAEFQLALKRTETKMLEAVMRRGNGH